MSSHPSKPRHPALPLLLAPFVLAVVACGGTTSGTPGDGGLGPDGSRGGDAVAADSARAPSDAGDSGTDTGSDTGTDTGSDTGPLPESGTDSGSSTDTGAMGDTATPFDATAGEDAATQMCTVGCGVPQTCSTLGAMCGAVYDGCTGSLLQCGTCPPGLTCGGAGPNQCGASDAACVPQTCKQMGASCGMRGDGCGGVLDCNPTCASLGFDCGLVADGCGNMIDCGACVTPKVCGGAGYSVCGTGTCVPKTCAALGFNCGPAGDGCGGTMQCGACSSNHMCGACSPGVCGLALPAP